MLFGKSKRHTEADVSPEEARKIIRWFEAEVADNESAIYGVALYFECLALFHAGQEDILETCRKQFRNIIQTGRTDGERAEAALAEARGNPQRAGHLRQFKFAHCQGHPQAGELLKRARILTKTYDTLFPGRPRSRPFKQEEVVQLLDQASEKI